PPGITPQQIAQCLNDVLRCPQQILSSIPAQAVWPIIGSYKASLNAQAVGRWQSLPENFIRVAQQYYPQINLRAVRIATNINTLHGQAITFFYDIYIPGGLDWTTRSTVSLILHELEHTVQYANRGGEQPFLSEYIAKAIGQIIQNKSVNIHDDIDIENAAIS